MKRKREPEARCDPLQNEEGVATKKKILKKRYPSGRKRKKAKNLGWSEDTAAVIGTTALGAAYPIALRAFTPACERCDCQPIFRLAAFTVMFLSVCCFCR